MNSTAPPAPEETCNDVNAPANPASTRKISSALGRCRGAVFSASGVNIHNPAYNNTPKPPAKLAATKNKRTHFASTPRYEARPAATPAITRRDLTRVSRGYNADMSPIVARPMP